LSRTLPSTPVIIDVPREREREAVEQNTDYCLPFSIKGVGSENLVEDFEVGASGYEACMCTPCHLLRKHSPPLKDVLHASSLEIIDVNAGYGMELCFVLPKVGYNANAMQKYLNLPIYRAAYYRHHHNPTSHKLAHPFPFVPTLPETCKKLSQKTSSDPALICFNTQLLGRAHIVFGYNSFSLL